MDYLSFINGSFTLDVSHQLMAYFSDGTKLNIEDSTAKGLEELCYYVANNVNRNNSFNIQRLIGFSYRDSDLATSYFVSTSKQDFFMFTDIDGSANVNLNAVVTDEVYIDDYNYIENYAHYNAYDYLPVNNQYGTFERNLTPLQSSVIFDYTSLHYELGSYRTHAYTIRGENIAFYEVYFQLDNVYADELTISYGSPVQGLLNDEYSRGYSSGYANGYVQGNQDGYIIGFNSNGGTPETANAFSYIGNAFEVVSNVMSLEILPHVTLGLAFSIPLVFTLIMVVFKLVRK